MMSRLFLLSIIILLSSCTLSSQPATITTTRAEAPNLVVVISVDQMRYEFLDRLYNKFGDDGFKRLMNDGYNYRNAHYTFMPTATGPGHSAIYSGAVPAVSGIIGNSWYDRSVKRTINVVGGLNHYHSIGIDSSATRGKAGPDRLLVTTIADEIKMASQFRSKVFSISIKDRSAVMGAGHRGDAGIWFDATTGNFVSSSYYVNELPDFVKTFNESGVIQKLNNSVWETTYPIADYTTSRADNNDIERNLKGDEGPTFPYDLKKLNANGSSYYTMVTTPFANEMVAQLSQEAIAKENLGNNGETDFLAISFSSTDYAGHGFGPYSIEVADMYIKLDRTIAQLLKSLDKEVGKGNYVVALTADHGAVPAPKYLMQNKLPGRPYSGAAVKSRMNQFLLKETGVDNIVEASDGFQIYLNHANIPSNKYDQYVDLIKSFLLKEDGIHTVFSKEVLESYSAKSPHIVQLLQNGFYAKRSGDIFFISKPGWLGVLGGSNATGHGTPFSYDSHVPVIFYGKNIPVGESVRKVAVTNIAPSLSMMCRVMFPSGSDGEVLEELFE